MKSQMIKAIGLTILFSAMTAVGADNAPKVTYLANEGFLLEHGGKKVLVDALFDTGPGRLLSPSAELLAQMTEAREPFANVDLLLVTHSHADHFSVKVVTSHMRCNTRCRLIAPAEAVDRLRTEEGFARICDRVREVTLAAGAREHVSLNGVEVEVLCLGGDDASDKTSRLTFVVNLNGVRFFHLGDDLIEQNETRLTTFPFEQTPIDILFLRRDDISTVAQQCIARRIKPSHIIAMHIPPAELAAEVQNVHTAYPHAIVFRQSMEQRSLPIEVDFHNLAGDYFGQTPPGATPQVFARGIVSTEENEHSAPSFSPDGNEVFWFANRYPDEGPRLSMTMRQENGRWSAPRITRFGIMPVFSPDSRRVYYYLPRPPLSAAQDDAPLDIWFAERKGDNWGEPQCLNLTLRYPELRLACMPTLTHNGTLYFLGYLAEAKVNQGIYRVEFINGEYTKPELLPRSINLPGSHNWAPFIAPDESYLLFSSDRPGALDDYGDLYVSRRRADGSWTDPVSLGEPVNTRSQECFPGLSPDGKYLFFQRHTPRNKGDVYWVEAASVPALRATHASPQGNTK